MTTSEADLASCGVGAELQEQVAHLKTEYSSVGDQLEQEQSRAQQVHYVSLCSMLTVLLLYFSYLVCFTASDAPFGLPTWRHSAP